MPATEADFEAFDQFMRGKHMTVAEVGIEMCKRFPTDEDQRALGEWNHKRVLDMWSGQAQGPTAEELITKIAFFYSSTNFNNEDSREELCRLIQRDYRPKLFVERLKSHHNYTAGKTPLPQNVLGVNTDSHPVYPKPPRNRRKENKSDDSVTSTESHEVDNNGFAFHQIGFLQSYEVDDNSMRFSQYVELKDEAAALENWEWDDTGFHVVVRIDGRGSAQGVYAIYVMFPKSEFGCARVPIDTPDGWGCLPRQDKCFSMAKMADTINDFEDLKRFDWSDIHYDTVEIVRAYQHEHPHRILRCVRPDK
ncbi:hypothetical protein PVAG01_11426 [Phlyctema vagabunda]|uniref:Uncharacterized protein n=1 Tax=Phlyctema vagabunda TaxID=108571 RepID=A0ABR4P2X5_9HELO